MNFHDSLTHTKIVTNFYMKKIVLILDTNLFEMIILQMHILDRSRDTIISMHTVVIAIVPHDRIMRAYLIKIEIINVKLPHG